MHHTRVTGRLARRYGGSVRAPRVGAARVRGLAAVAEENAREGCVRETYGALLAHWQAAHAADPRVARAMRAIARDETKHAELAHAVHRWALEQLTVRERARVERTRRAAESTLLHELVATLECPALGLPGGRVARELAERLFGALRA